MKNAEFESHIYLKSNDFKQIHSWHMISLNNPFKLYNYLMIIINLRFIMSLSFIICASILFLTGISFAEIIPSTRRIDWTHSGIPGGIPERTTIFKIIDASIYGDGKTDATAAIQDAIDNCPANQVVYLPAGTYIVTIPNPENAETILNMRSNVTLRGAGQGNTIISFPGTYARSVIDIRGSAYNDIYNLKRSFDITGGIEKGSNQIILNSVNGISVGDILLIDQLNDPLLVDPVGFEGLCTYCGRENGSRARGQYTEVTSIQGNTVTFSIPLYWTLNPSLLPQATLINAYSMVRWAGIESVTITESQPAVEFMIEMDAAQYSWLRNVEIKQVKRRAVWLIESLQNEIRESYFHDGIGGFGRDRGYGVLVDAYSTANLIENNIFHTIDGGFMMAAGGASGNVFGYNFMIDSKFDDEWWLTASPSLSHAPHPSMNLWEGNIGIQAAADFIHGSSSHNTVFRSRFSGWQSPTITANNNAIEFQYKCTYMNVLGCVLGTAGQSAIYEVAYPDPTDPSMQKTIWRLGYGGPSWAGDTNVKATLLRHGNYDCVNDSVLWDTNIINHNLPASLYRSTTPNWWGNLSWPAIGPDSSNPGHVLNGKIPAQVRYESGILGISEQDVEKLSGLSMKITINTQVRIDFKIHHTDFVRLEVYNISGTMICNLLNEQKPAGLHPLYWNINGIPSGVYLFKLMSGGEILVQKGIIIE